MRFLQLALLLSALCFGNELYTVRADGTGTYLTPQACEDANSNSLLGRGRVECRETQGATYTSTLTITGQTNTSETNYFVFSGTTGILGTTLTANSASQVATIGISYGRIEKVTIINTNAGATAVANTSGAGTDFCVFDMVTIKHTGTGGYGIGTGGGTNVVFRNVAAIATAVNNTGNGFFCANSGTQLDMYNCVSIGFGTAVNAFASTSILATNVIAIPKSGGVGFTGTITQSYNISSDATATGTGSITNKTFAQVMASDSIHITTASAAYGVGANLSGQFTQDIDGQTWSHWSIGADDPTPVATKSKKCGPYCMAGWCPKNKQGF